MKANLYRLPLAWRDKLLTDSVMPRPIAVVSSVSAEGATDVALFSYFSIAGHDPLAVSFTITRLKLDRGNKDTLRKPDSFECRTHTVVAIGCYANLVIAYVRDDLIDGEGRIDFDSLGSVGRLSDAQYFLTTGSFELTDEGCFPSKCCVAVSV